VQARRQARLAAAAGAAATQKAKCGSRRRNRRRNMAAENPRQWQNEEGQKIHEIRTRRLRRVPVEKGLIQAGGAMSRSRRRQSGTGEGRCRRREAGIDRTAGGRQPIPGSSLGAGRHLQWWQVVLRGKFLSPRPLRHET